MQGKSRIISRILLYLIYTIIGIIFFMPFLWMLSTSLKSKGSIFVYPPQFIPHPARWVNYKEAVHAMPFLIYLRNSVFITVMAIIGTVISSSFVAYAFAKLKWRARDKLFFLVLFTAMFPLQVTMIPVFILYKNLGWLDSFKPLIIPYFFGGGAFNIFLMRQFFLTIPESLSEAARIDGCSEFGIYWTIILPLVKPVMITVALFTFLLTWNDFMGPLIFLSTKEKGTLALGLAMFVGQHGTEWNLLMAASVLILIPIVIIFIFCQRYFIEGITMTGMKG
jgi:ABC-type glycerol-3-phosphate transport system permease component